MNNPGIDLMIRLKNGYMAHRASIESPYSRFRENILTKLKALGYVEDFTISGEIIKSIAITLKYDDEEGAMSDVKIYSTPGRRWYSGVKELKGSASGLGVTLLSTPEGILTHKEARDKKVGGELLFSIW